MASSVQIIGTDKLRKALQQAGQLATNAMAAAMVAEMQAIVRKATTLVPANTGNLKASGTVFPPSIQGTKIEVVGGFGNAATKYAVWVHEGRRPGSKAPPVAAIKQWVHDKGLPDEAAFPIARAIAKRGIPGPGRPDHRKFLERPFLEAAPGMGERLGAELLRALERMRA